MSQIESIVEPDRLNIVRSISHLMHGVGNSEFMREDESCEMDLAKDEFKVIAGGNVLLQFFCQSIATYHRDDETFSWTKGNEIESVRGSLPELKDLNQDQLIINEKEAIEISTYLALRAGFHGAYPYFQKNGQTEFLALRLVNQDHEEKSPLWCSTCGRLPHEVKKLAGVDTRFFICSTCAEMIADVLEAEKSSEPHAKKGSEQFCAVCGKTELCQIAMPYAFICNDDAQMIANFSKSLD